MIIEMCVGVWRTSALLLSNFCRYNFPLDVCCCWRCMAAAVSIKYTISPAKWDFLLLCCFRSPASAYANRSSTIVRKTYLCIVHGCACKRVHTHTHSTRHLCVCECVFALFIEMVNVISMVLLVADLPIPIKLYIWCANGFSIFAFLFSAFATQRPRVQRFVVTCCCPNGFLFPFIRDEEVRVAAAAAAPKSWKKKTKQNRNKNENRSEDQIEMENWEK